MSLSSGRGTYLGRKSPGIENSFPQHTVTYGYPILTPESEWFPSIIDKPKTDNEHLMQIQIQVGGKIKGIAPMRQRALMKIDFSPILFLKTSIYTQCTYSQNHRNNLSYYIISREYIIC